MGGRKRKERVKKKKKTMPVQKILFALILCASVWPRVAESLDVCGIVSQALNSSHLSIPADCVLSDELLLAAGDNKKISAAPGSARKVRVSAAPRNRHFRVNGVLHLQNLLLHGGKTSGHGGSILATGYAAVLNLTDITFQENVAELSGSAIAVLNGASITFFGNSLIQLHRFNYTSPIFVHSTSHIQLNDEVAF